MSDGWLNAEILARVQFAFTISFHIIFPSFTIGLASFLALVEGLWLVTGKSLYLDLFKHWVKIFALSFGMGVVSGVVMSYQFGTNWGPFSVATGSVLGPLLGYEVLTAFFLEAGFLGIMLFGMDKVGPRLHFLATLLVAIGTLISAFWILSANSWMQTPAGYALDPDGRFHATNWLEVVFNPSFPYRFVHMVTAAFLTSALVISAASAWRLLKGDGQSAATRHAFSLATGLILVAAPLQVLLGDAHGLNTLAYQPAKIAAMEGHWAEEVSPAPLILFGIPDEAREETRFSIEIPSLGSLILTHSLDGAIKGMKAFPPDERPPMAIPFFAFRIMVGLGFLMVGLGTFAGVQRLRGRLSESPLLHWYALAMGPMGFVAILAGWFTTEVGRQPYVVHGLMRTEDGISPIAAPGAAASLVAFVLVYGIVFTVGIRYMLKMMGSPVKEDDPSTEDGPFAHPGPINNGETSHGA
ncbi:MAG: cytochrome ubiquinol oxidase subunit I [Rhodospirillum sp.]|nr:cytochrome ubiquinol oxidase subunit I [Rhodospirillum sp.]MCF8491861.1 cytochrome ubiquinol oxidase subunit I [Rhodospirillum sp.]MCF8501138.1 cytochrome ubiquinol oxidase subunit I [Rhodospirillum sp.]